MVAAPGRRQARSRRGLSLRADRIARWRPHPLDPERCASRVRRQPHRRGAPESRAGASSVRLEDGRMLALGKDNPQLRHLDHAWASTVHAFQGRTVDNVIAVMKANHPHLTMQKSFYVKINHAHHRAELVTDDAEALREHLEASTGKRVSALERIGQEPRKAVGSNRREVIRELLTERLDENGSIPVRMKRWSAPTATWTYRCDGSSLPVGSRTKVIFGRFGVSSMCFVVRASSDMVRCASSRTLRQRRCPTSIRSSKCAAACRNPFMRRSVTGYRNRHGTANRSRWNDRRCVESLPLGTSEKTRESDVRLRTVDTCRISILDRNRYEPNPHSLAHDRFGIHGIGTETLFRRLKISAMTR